MWEQLEAITIHGVLGPALSAKVVGWRRFVWGWNLLIRPVSSGTQALKFINVSLISVPLSIEDGK